MKGSESVVWGAVSVFERGKITKSVGREGRAWEGQFSGRGCRELLCCVLKGGHVNLCGLVCDASSTHS